MAAAAAGATSTFDRVAPYIEQPNFLRHQVVADQCVAGLQRQLGTLGHDRARSAEVVLYICLYLENAIPDEKAGPRRKEVALQVLRPHLADGRDQQVMGDLIDFVCARQLVKKTPFFKRLYKVFVKWLEYKIF